MKSAFNRIATRDSRRFNDSSWLSECICSEKKWNIFFIKWTFYCVANNVWTEKGKADVPECSSRGPDCQSEMLMKFLVTNLSAYKRTISKVCWKKIDCLI
jgi:hypothetical protein